MMKIILCLLATLFISPAFAQVHKWKDANGQTHYGDAPVVTGTTTVYTPQQTDEQIADGYRIRAETARSIRQREANEAQQDLLAQQERARQEGIEQRRFLRDEAIAKVNAWVDAGNTASERARRLAVSGDRLRAYGLNNAAQLQSAPDALNNAAQLQSAPDAPHGAINSQTGQYLPGVAGGVINPTNGQFYPEVAGGYINPATGQFMPAQ